MLGEREEVSAFTSILLLQKPPEGAQKQFSTKDPKVKTVPMREWAPGSDARGPSPWPQFLLKVGPPPGGSPPVGEPSGTD